MSICAKEVINQNTVEGGRVRMPGLDWRSSNIIEGDNCHFGIFSVSVSLFGENIAQDELVLSCINNRISHSIDSICIRLQVANHPCRFIYPTRKMLNYLIAF